MASSKTLGPFPLGMDNRLSGRDLEALDPGTRTRVPLLRSVVNADVDNEGRLKRRRGRTQVHAAPLCHSLWSPGGNEAYFVTGTTLVRATINDGAATVTTVATGLAPDAQMSYAKVGQDIYYTNGDVLARIDGPYVPDDNVPVDSYGITEIPLTTKMPPGRIIRYHAGRLLIASGAFLFYSEPYAGWNYDPVRGFIPMPADITVVEPCENGVYVVADKTYWFGGEIGTAEASVVSPNRAVFGTGGSDPEAVRCWWMSDDGLMRGEPGGTVTTVTGERITTRDALRGATTLIERNGTKHHVTSTFNPSSTSLAARSFMEAEIVRKETEL